MAYDELHLQERKDRIKRWQEANPERRAAYGHTYYLEHRDELFQQRLLKIEREREVKRAWRAANREKHNGYSRTRTARKKRPFWADQDAIKLFYDNRPPGMEVDHIVPLAGITADGYPVSGLHVDWNLQYLPKAEHRRKINRMRAQDH